MDDQEARLRNQLLLGLRGDERAYRIFLQELSARLRAFFRKRLTSLPDEVEDLVQESLLAIHNQRHTYDSGMPLTAWVHAIAKYKLIDFLRRRARHDGLNEILDEEMTLDQAEDAPSAGTRRDLAKLLEQLPERQRLPIIYMKLEGHSVEDTAKLTGMSASAVKVGVHRGLKVLAAIIRGER